MFGVNELLERLKSDSDFRARFANVKSKEEAINFAKAEGYDLEKLSEDELDNVAGGNKDEVKKTLQDAYQLSKEILDIFSWFF